ncbi:MAG TPA: hypothetical protein VM733_19700 [Thermoanaerobaculia bacterium]|nr:hypothetical protein [Thermoanaerobaculia bacterium]
MNKILLGLILGALLGAIDGGTAWFTPEVRNQMLGIIFGSTMKGVIAGIAAGIFARRVKNTFAGIVFGLIVGAALAYAVIYLGGGLYFWEIMLPGAAVGAILGWATQRYGRTSGSARTSAALAMVALALVGFNAKADHNHEAKPAQNATFEKLKALEGTWDANMLTPDGQKTTVIYKVSAGGSVVQETLFAGTPMEMINMFTVEGDTVVATHFCSGDNQPTMRLNNGKSKSDDLVFDFVNVRGKNTSSNYINGLTVKLGADGRVEETYSTSAEGTHMKLYLNGKR